MGLSEVVPSTSRSIVQALGGGRMTAAFCVSVTGLVWLLAGGAPAANAADCANEATRVGASADLPNCRAYEMVSPADKGGQDVVASPVFGFDSVPVLSTDGESVAFESYGAFSEPNSNGVISNYLARRAPAAWNSEKISPPIEPNPSLNTAAAEAFTPDFAVSVFLGPWNPPLAPGASPGTSNLYLRDNSDGSFSLVSAGAPPELGQSEWAPVAVSEDGSHVIFGANGIELTPDASETISPFLYVWDRATETLTLEARLPDESVSPAAVTLAGQTGSAARSIPPTRSPATAPASTSKPSATGARRRSSCGSTTARPRKSPPRSGPRRPPPNRPTSSSPRMTAKSRSSPAPSC